MLYFYLGSYFCLPFPNPKKWLVDSNKEIKISDKSGCGFQYNSTVSIKAHFVIQ